MEHKPNKEPMSNKEFGKLRSYLAQKGIEQNEISKIIGDETKNRNREEIIKILIDWLGR